MKQIRGWIALAVLQWALAPAAAAAAPDAGAMWKQFLAGGNYNKSMAAYGVLTSTGYNGSDVDAASCKEHAADLRSAVETVPVSIAIRRVAYLCADATGETAAADREMEVLAALSRHALKQAGDPQVARPIAIVAPADAYALLLTSGMEEKYEYYLNLRPLRYFPMVLVAWDADAGTERHLAFDYVDVLQQLHIEQPQFQGMPIVRDWMASAFLDGGPLAALDISAMRSAAMTDVAADKLAKIRGAAQSGGLQSMKGWLFLCARKDKPAGCTDGLMDALLAQAEQKNAVPMAMLAYAYFDGIGTRADPAAAWTLLDAAERKWPGGALQEFADLWATMHADSAFPVRLQERLDAAARTYPVVRRFLLQREVAGKKPHLGEGDMAFLANAGENGRGLGYGLLVDYYKKLEQPGPMWEWTIKAAEAGNATAQSWYAMALIYGEQAQVKRDAAKGAAFAAQAAHGADAWGARQAAFQRVREGDYAAAEGWLLAPADVGDIDSIMYLANFYEQERAGVTGKIDRAIELYQMLARLGEPGAPARRALAELAIDGRGMPKDPAKAMQWLRADADNGDHDSEVMLAMHYLEGDFGKVDETEGVRWMQRAIKAGNEDAFTAYSSWLFYTKDTTESRAQALELLARGHAGGNIGASNNYAWALCTSPRTEIYDAKRGLEVSTKLGDVETMAPGVLDTVAACYAATGDFKRAVELQTRAARELAAFDTPEAAEKRKGKPAGYQKRLDLYKAGKRYEEFEHNQ
jgi:TPR repeat protein